ncbi:MAG TPA: SIS domain-containing protein [Thermoleophilaceae bacterium]|nr:SIS domain-containing protein [Thermoleophilaceae bacterium]
MSQLEREIGEQPAVLERALVESADAIRAAAADVRRSRPRYAVVAARGSSDNAARYFQHLFGRVCGIPVMLATPSLHTLYGAGLRYEDALVVGVSQSGASPDVVSVLQAAGAGGGLTVAVTNEPRSPLADAARHVLELHAGPERSVAATKTYTASLGMLAALTVAVAESSALERELRGMPDALDAQLRRDGVAAAAETLVDSSRLAVIGRGANYATAFEAALKLKELAGIAAEPASPADFLHGPIAIVDTGVPVLAFAIAGPTLASMRGVLADVRDRGGEAIVVGDASLGGEAALGVEAAPEWLSPLVAVMPAQRLAAELAERRGDDVDRPFGLAKVTLTR